ncbi:MAG: fimbrillin family protein [Alistipes sp.]|jgi:hypothetical protein|nr:fimbrillin family protein [Alistipes sp.]
MNRIIKTATILCVSFALGGCIKGDEPRPEPEARNDVREMRFGVSSPAATRSNTFDNADEITSMGVFGFSTGATGFASATDRTPNLLYNQKLTRVQDDWEYNPVVYWPLDEGVNNSFFAYSPHSSEFPASTGLSVSAADKQGHPTLTYTIPAGDIDEMRDILVATPVLDKNRDSSDTEVDDGMVTYRMRHALSGIAFLFSAFHPDEQVEEPYYISSVNLTADNLPVSATLDLGYAPTVSDVYGDGAWGEARMGGVNWNLKLAYDPDLEPGFEMSSTDVVDPTTENGVNTLLLLPKDIDASTRAMVNVGFRHHDKTYAYSVPMPPAYMHAGLVTVFLVTVSVDGISVEFHRTNTIEEWTDGSPGGVENVEMF